MFETIKNESWSVNLNLFSKINNFVDFNKPNESSFAWQKWSLFIHYFIWMIKIII